MQLHRYIIYILIIPIHNINCLYLGHVGRPAHFDVPASYQHVVHLLQGELRRFGHLVLYEREPVSKQYEIMTK